MWWIALLISAGAAYLYEKSSKGFAAIACIPIALIGLLLALILAPWQVQLMLLVPTFLSYSLIKVESD